jgi:Complex 1 protein (LYR family)
VTVGDALESFRGFLAPKCNATVRISKQIQPISPIFRELPRVLMIYDIDMPLEEAKSSIRSRFYDNKNVKDPRVVEMLVEMGYFSLETSMLQHKQKNHLMHYLEGYTVPMEAERKRLMSPDASIEEQFARN